MKSINVITRKAVKLETSLRCRKEDLYENYGQKEVEVLENFVGDIYEYPYTERQTINLIIRNFDNWCMNYTGDKS